jgi:hypothetical protein
VSELDMNAAARRASLNATVWAGAEAEADLDDGDRIARIAERLGNVAYAYRHGLDIDADVLMLACSVMAWCEQNAERAAR